MTALYVISKPWEWMQTVFLALNVEYEGYKQEEKIFKRLESPYYVDQSQNNIHQHKTSYIRSDIS